jgi:hypothetical protein
MRCDNQGAIAQMCNPIDHPRARHINVGHNIHSF